MILRAGDNITDNLGRCAGIQRDALMSRTHNQAVAYRSFSALAEADRIFKSFKPARINIQLRKTNGIYCHGTAFEIPERPEAAILDLCPGIFNSDGKRMFGPVTRGQLPLNCHRFDCHFAFAFGIDEYGGSVSSNLKNTIFSRFTYQCQRLGYHNWLCLNPLRDLYSTFRPGRINYPLQVALNDSHGFACL